MARRTKGKKLVYISESLVDSVAKISRSRGESIGKMIEDSLKEAITVTQEGYDIKQVADYFAVMQAYRVLGGAYVPSDILDYLLGEVYPHGREQLISKIFESGRWQGKYLNERFEDPLKAFNLFLEFSRWDLNEAEVIEQGNSIKIRCVSTVLTKEGTELLAKFIEGVMDGLGYRISKKDCLKGLILIECEILK